MNGPARGSEAILHATCVALSGRALLIRGPSMSGKSALALHLMAFGASLVADDRTLVSVRDADLIAAAPATLPALIEARFLGLLPADLHPPCPVFCVLDMGRRERQRLPASATCEVLGVRLPLFAGRIGPHLVAALIQMLKTGRTPA